MNQQRVSLRLGAAACILAVLIRLTAAGFFAPLAALLQNEDLVSLLIYLETGRAVRFAPMTHSPTLPDATEASKPQPTIPEPTQPTEPVFEQEALSYIDIHYSCAYRPDLNALMEKSLTWDLTGDAPKVLILHSHATEGYEGTEGYRTTDEGKNMVSIGDEVARILEAGGISVLHDRTLHDYPSYEAAYANARKSIAAYLKDYPSIQLILDLHRDASGNTGGELVTSATVGGQRSAQIMMVVGTDESGNYHPNWQENLSLALKLTAQLEQYNPGICRPINLRAQRFNMDMTPGSLLVEIGGAGNTHQEAIIAANALAQAVLELANGANLEG